MWGRAALASLRCSACEAKTPRWPASSRAKHGRGRVTAASHRTTYVALSRWCMLRRLVCM